jgi:KaiC/GvpD/RAD55 family RecA-like ATPase
MIRGDLGSQTLEKKALSGVAGLDEVIRGGFPRNRLYVVEGNPGAGKTALALQFLPEGLRRGETVLYVTLSETTEELHEVAESHGRSLDARLQDDADYIVELGETSRRYSGPVQPLWRSDND